MGMRVLLEMEEVEEKMRMVLMEIEWVAISTGGEMDILENG